MQIVWRPMFDAHVMKMVLYSHNIRIKIPCRIALSLHFMPRTRFSPLFSSPDSISIHTFTQTTMRHEPFQPHCVWMCFLYAHVDNFEILKQTEKMIFFLRFPSHSCLNKNNFVMISICKKNTQTKSHQSNGTMKSYGFRTRLEWKTLNKTSQPTRAHTHKRKENKPTEPLIFFSPKNPSSIRVHQVSRRRTFICWIMT